MLSAATKAGWPMRRRWPLTTPSRPKPGWLSTCSAAQGARPKARAIGCSERFSSAAAKPITISIDTAGDYFWNSERLTFDDLLIRLKGLKTSNADPKVLIEGEIGAQFGKAVAVVDEARSAGINKVTFNTSARTSVR